MTDYADLVAKIEAATQEFNKAGAAQACDDVIARMQGDEAPVPVLPIRTILQALRNNRYFDLMERVCSAAILSDQTDAQVRRQYAQALIDGGSIMAAISVLTVLVADTSDTGSIGDPTEHAKARGLIGRAYKQAYVIAVNRAPDSPESVLAGTDQYARARANRKHLERATMAYFDVYESDRDRWLWHGINTVACLCRAERDGIPLRGYPSPLGLAAGILETVTARTQVDNWDRATALEACVALGRVNEALDWLALYATNPDAEAFELASTLRQLTEVWQLTSTAAPGTYILPILRAALLQRKGGGIELSHSPQSAASSIQQEKEALETVLGDTRFVPLEWYRKGLERCLVVARIEDQWGRGFGSGFLVCGEDLHPKLAGALLLTNAHVIGDASSCKRARVRFEAREEGKSKTYGVAQLIWTSPPNKLDASLLRLDESLRFDPPYIVSAELPIVDKDRVYVIGHPNGGTLSLSIQDNRVIDAKVPKLHYRAPTEPGSSGSPVFNKDWELVALHHAGRTELPALSDEGPREANEGIWMSSIVQALKEELVLE